MNVQEMYAQDVKIIDIILIMENVNYVHQKDVMVVIHQMENVQNVLMVII